MSEPIKVGDLVMLVRECCPVDSAIGKIFSVAELRNHSYWCHYCRWSAGQLSGARVNGQDSHCSYPLSWLKRIPPLSELEGENRDEEITA